MCVCVTEKEREREREREREGGGGEAYSCLTELYIVWLARSSHVNLNQTKLANHRCIKHIHLDLVYARTFSRM